MVRYSGCTIQRQLRNTRALFWHYKVDIRVLLLPFSDIVPTPEAPGPTIRVCEEFEASDGVFGSVLSIDLESLKAYS